VRTCPGEVGVRREGGRAGGRKGGRKGGREERIEGGREIYHEGVDAVRRRVDGKIQGDRVVPASKKAVSGAIDEMKPTEAGGGRMGGRKGGRTGGGAGGCGGGGG